MNVILTSKVNKSIEATIIIIAAGIVTLTYIVINTPFLCAILTTVWVCMSMICVLMLREIDMYSLARIEFANNEMVVAVSIFRNGRYTMKVYHAKYIDITSIFEDKATRVVTISGVFDCFEIAEAGTKVVNDIIVDPDSRRCGHLSIKVVPIGLYSIQEYIMDNSPLHVVSK